MVSVFLLLAGPLAGWLAARITEAWCVKRGKPISVQPRMLQAAMAGLGLTVALGAVLGGDEPFERLTFALVGWALLTAAAIDWIILRLPNSITLPLIALGLIHAGLDSQYQLIDRALGCSLGYLGLTAVAALYEKARGRSGLGLGDAKLLAAGGGWTGWQGLAPILLVGAVITLLVVCARAWWRGEPLDGHTAIPFGPGLALGFFIILIASPG